MDYIGMLKELCTYPAVSGFEKKLSEHIKTLFENHCDSVHIDKFYSVIGYKKGSSSGKKVMVTAHIDEIGLLVSSIDEKGFIRFTDTGGVDSKILLAQEVIIHGKQDICGIIGAKPPHLLKAEETGKAVKFENLAIDTGLPADSIRKLVSVGDIITLKSEVVALQGNKVSSRSIDNKCGLLAMLDIMEELKRTRHDHDVFFVATSQEEFELTGAITASFNIFPDAAIVLDATHGDMPDASKDETFVLGKGPAISVGPNLHRKLTKKLMETARDINIPYQTEVVPGNTGTEAWATQVSRSGIPSVLVSIPVRYMHTTVETVNLNDIKTTGRLVSRYISVLDFGTGVDLCC